LFKLSTKIPKAKAPIAVKGILTQLFHSPKRLIQNEKYIEKLYILNMAKQAICAIKKN